MGKTLTGRIENDPFCMALAETFNRPCDKNDFDVNINVNVCKKNLKINTRCYSIYIFQK